MEPFRLAQPAVAKLFASSVTFAIESYQYNYLPKDNKPTQPLPVYT